jgi:tetratricopeptide (TPR) repeat protein
MNRPVIHLLAIIVLTLLSYSNTFYAPFHFDDPRNIAENFAIRDLHNFLDTSHFTNVEINDNLRPFLHIRYIGYLSFALNYAAHGLDVRGYHVVNILIHITNALLLYALLRLTFRTPRFLDEAVADASFSDNFRSFVALFTALLFAVHPIETQAVTYIVQRFASLAALFYLLSLVTYIRFRLLNSSARSPMSYFFYLISVVSAIAAMKTKEFALLLPIIIMCYEFVFFNDKPGKRILLLLPYLVTICLVPLSMVNVNTELLSDAHGNIPRIDYLLTQFRVLVTYLRLLILPINQNLDYDYPVYRSLLVPEVFLSLLLLTAILALGIWMHRKSRNRKSAVNCWLLLASSGIFWFFLTAAPESSVFPIKDVIFEHRMYLPSIGLFLAGTVSIGLVIQRWHNRFPWIRNTAVTCMAIVIVILSIATYARNNVWKNPLRLLEDIAGKSPNKARTHHNLKLEYVKQQRFDDALKSDRTERIINARDADIHFKLGHEYAEQGRIDDAIYEYRTSLQLKPGDADTHFNLGFLYAKQGRNLEATNEYVLASSLRPDDALTRNNLGNVYKKLGRIDDALKEFTEALRIKPDFVEAHYNLGNTYAGMGRIKEARNEYRTALRLKPDFREAQRQLDNYLE